MIMIACLVPLILSTQAVELRHLVEEADLKNFVFVDEHKQEWQSYETPVKSSIQLTRPK